MKPNFKQLTRKINEGNTVNIRHLVFREIEGFKSESDKILQLNTFGSWINLTFTDLLKILKFWFENEKRVYNKPNQKGSKYVLEAIQKLESGCTVEQVLNEFGDKHSLT